MRALIVIAVVVASAATARAYPQFQLVRGTTCAACHLSPSGGGLLNDNGRFNAEDLAARDGDARFLSGAWTPPGWLALGGDFRFGGGINDAGDGSKGGAYPMQLEVDARAATGGVSLNVVAGLRGVGQRPSGLGQVREHYVMWRPDGDEPYGAYVRAGHFAPVYGLRLVEHTDYVRRYTSNDLYSEVYGVGGGYVAPAGEVHVTAFVHDPFDQSAERGDGGAIYAELRAGERATVGASGRFASSAEDRRTQGGLTAKLWLERWNLLFMAEGDLIRQTFVAGPSRTALASNLVASYVAARSWRVDVHLGAYQEDLHVRGTDREAVDANLAWFVTPHWELGALSRLELLARGSGGPTNGWLLVQAHYRF